MKTLSAAVLAGIGLAGTAQAVHVNPDGLGEVLLYPYYTVQRNFDTYISVVNTSSTEVKAVKVRFLEGKNSQEVLDFNLYLSPRDEWTAAITQTESGAGITSDHTSCIAPRQLPKLGEAPEEFRNFEYVDDSVNTTARTREGYVEIIEMGVVRKADLAAAATHTRNGATVVNSPTDCALIQAAATLDGFLNAQEDPADVTEPTGGLYGYISQIAVRNGVKTSHDAIALDSFYDPLVDTFDLHTPPGSTAPGLDQVFPAVANVLSNTGLAVINSPAADPLLRPIDAVSMTLMADQVVNDYAVDLDRVSRTDWVITFPTKRYYVETSNPQPFNEVWDPETNTSCDPVLIAYWDREEQVALVSDDFSPPPPSGAPTQLCNEVNTISVKPNGAPDDYITLYDAEFTAASFPLDPGFQAGWMSVAFRNPGSWILDANGIAYFGLPAIGFSSINNTNNVLEFELDGELVQVLSNYMSSITHKKERVLRCYDGVNLEFDCLLDGGIEPEPEPEPIL